MNATNHPVTRDEHATTTALTRPQAPDTPSRIVEPAWRASRHDRGNEIEIALPGVRKEDIRLEARDRRILLEATRQAPRPEGELVYGSPAPDGYRLELRLGRALDGASLKAKLEDGLLKVSVPLVEAAQPRQIPIA